MHPILLQLGPLALPSYGLFVLLGLALGLLLTPRYARRAQIDPHQAQRLILRMFAGGVIGCRLLEMLVRWRDLLERPEPLYWVTQAGVWYGAVIGGLLTAALTVRARGWSFGQIADVAAVPAVIGGGIGRIGCLLSGCCFGTATSLPWAITYTNPIAHRLHADLPEVPVHPTPIYELLGALAIGAALDRYGQRSRPVGAVVLLYLALYGLLRFLLEFVRGDQGRGLLAGLSTSQAIGLIALLLGGSAWWWRTRHSGAAL